ncbi:MAG: SAM-dependent DNA methyltransferase [Chloroflexi bacterium]|nr:SAM-dependent DNA methyltransferase [Chloroflexota bacterium]
MLLDKRKKNGVFYTSIDIAKYLTNRVLYGTNGRILEPSFGDGAFINAIINHYRNNNATSKLKDNFFGIELQEEAIRKYSAHPFFDEAKIIHSDFIAVDPFPVDVVIGNPPYVGLNKLPDEERDRAQHLIELFGYKMQSSGSLWFPFVLHSCSFLRKEGAIAFVLPFEVTYVRYAKQLWNYLGKNFKAITIIRVFEDMFPGVGVETVLLVANGYGESTNFVNYEIFSDKASLFNNQAKKQNTVAIESTLNGDRPFVSNLLDRKDLNIFYKLRSKGVFLPINQVCKFKIGYVSADKNYFHPSEEVIDEFDLPTNELLPAIANAKALKSNIGLFIKDGSVTTRLFYPGNENVSANSRTYIKHGENIGVNNRYKCRQRTPWYITPVIEVPEIFLTVFGEKPRFYINEGNYIASNSLLCGFIQNGHINPRQIAASWYNSLTLLSIELRIHSLGGGVLVFIPGEADTIEIIDPHILDDLDENYYTKVENLLKDGNIGEVYLLGDELLKIKVGLKNQEIESIRNAVGLLRSWRNARLRKTLEREK